MKTLWALTILAPLLTLGCESTPLEIHGLNSMSDGPPGMQEYIEEILDAVNANQAHVDYTCTSSGNCNVLILWDSYGGGENAINFSLFCLEGDCELAAP